MCCACDGGVTYYNDDMFCGCFPNGPAFNTGEYENYCAALTFDKSACYAAEECYYGPDQLSTCSVEEFKYDETE